MGYVERKAGGALFAGITVVLGCALISFWPWILGTHIALKNGARKGSTAYDLAGWLPEVGWLVLLVVGGTLIMRTSTKTAKVNAEKRAAVAAYNAPRAAGGGAFTHGSCTIRHRTVGAAVRCNGRR